MNGENRRYVLIFGALSILLSALAGAQTVAPAATPETKADTAYTGHDWSFAESSYASLVAHDPTNARFWYRLGVSQRGNQHYPEALNSLEKARVLGAGKGLSAFLVDYEEATTYAAMGNPAQGIDLLRKSASGGFAQPSRLESDAAWNAVRQDPQFVALAKQVAHNAAPCEDAEFKQLDFWIGDWDVTSPDGIQRGTSHISKEMGGCVIWENWSSANSPYFGKSYNTYNVSLKRWEQYWVDNSAGTIFFSGNLNGTVMDYWTDDVPQSNGDRLRRHLQFFNLSPTRVRQFSQGSTDGGKTWTVEYDFTYNRHETKNGSPL